MQLYGTRVSNGYMTVIPSRFKGILFRSKAEAMWAVILTALGADWHYEVEGYNLGNGLSYLPDFVIHNVQCLPVHDGLINKNDYKTCKWFNNFSNRNSNALKDQPRITYDVYIEVKGGDVITPEERLKTETFFSKLDQLDKPSLGVVVGRPPRVNNYNDLMRTLEEQIYNKEQKGFYSLNMYGSKAIPVYDSRFGGFTLYYGLLNGLPKEDRYRTLGAYISGLSAKFDHHGEPHIYTTDETKRLEWDIHTEGEHNAINEQLLKNIRNN